MHWVVHAGLGREAGFYALLDEIRRQRRPLTLVLPTAAGGYAQMLEDGATRPFDACEIESPAYVCGTISMERAFPHLRPGYVGAPTQRECVAAWGDAMLNHDAAFGPIADITPPDSPRLFVRPDADGKGFTGRLIDEDRFGRWRDEILSPDNPRSLSPETQIMIATPKTLWSEYRCILVDGRYVTGSRYRVAGRVEYGRDVGHRISSFAEGLASTWSPSRLLCVDVADTPDGLKAIELNAPSSAGFYLINFAAYVEAVSSLGTDQ